MGDILSWLEDEGKDVKFVKLVFSDIFGMLRGFYIPVEEFEDALKDGKGFDGSSIAGFARIEDSDLTAKPDKNAFYVLPWSYDGYRVAYVMCDVLKDNKPYEGDPRYALKKAIERARQKGYDNVYAGVEMEYFYFKDSCSPTPIDNGKYFDSMEDFYGFVRKQTMMGLEEMGITAECDHHEVAMSQHEIDLKYSDALKIADEIMLFRFLTKEYARRNGIYATFMPKPLNGHNGSGMHIHQSLWKGGRNAFFDENDEHYLSSDAKGYIAGLLQHINEITALLNQWINSYKRLVPGYEAPVYKVWGVGNRSALIRVPKYEKGKEKAMRIELRSPDPAANPYFVMASMIIAGLKGIEKGYELPEPYQKNVYALSANEKEKIKRLPENLEVALNELRESELAKEILGSHIHSRFIELKEKEIEEYKGAADLNDIKVTQYEIEKYYPML